MKSLNDRLLGVLELSPTPYKDRRQAFCDFLREHEHEVFAGAKEDRREIRELVGWDDDAFQRFIESTFVSQSSPHASPNIFAPNFAHPWVHAIAQRWHPGAVHLRTLVTYNNLGDAKYKPYAWWHRTPSGQVSQTVLFTRSHSVRHKVLLSQPFPYENGLQDPLLDVDRHAWQLASHATNYAYGAMIYRNAIERAAGLHEPKGIVEAPIDVMNRFAVSDPDFRKWIAKFRQVSMRPDTVALRTLTDGGEMAPLHDEDVDWSALPNQSFVCHNYLNFAQTYAFGIAMMTGGKKMASYLKNMNSIIAEILYQNDVAFYEPEFFPVMQVPTLDIMSTDSQTAAFFQEKNIAGCLAVGVGDHGRNIRMRLDEIAEEPYTTFYPEWRDHLNED